MVYRMTNKADIFSFAIIKTSPKLIKRIMIFLIIQNYIKLSACNKNVVKKYTSLGKV